jgi:isopentenyldiphosphate isomerase
MNQPDFPQDPDELFDVVDADGTPTGEVKRRADVHCDGDWHRAIHVWIYGVDATGPFILFNWRSLLKDTMPGRLDVTVGGHLGAGETVADAFREIEEEIGAALDPARFEFLFRRQAYGDTEREVQDVFLVRDDRDLAAYQPNPAELAGLVRLSLATARTIFAESQATGEGLALHAGSGKVATFRVDASNLLPPRYIPYYLAITEAVAARVTTQPTPLA